MKKLIIIPIVLLTIITVSGQRYITKNGYIKFYSETPIETIEAHNRQVNSALDISTGDFVFKVLMKSFSFEKALMQEHFNENYVESDAYPNATFKGQVINISDLEIKPGNELDVMIEGDLTIHGITRTIKEEGVFQVENDKLRGNSVFIVKPADYDIKIPTAVVNNIAEEIEVTVQVELDKYESK
jgi:polyisoprenoid-binding protein YceI